MSYTVYGFRLRGSTEARYIGQTGENPKVRLDRLTWEARKYGPPNCGGFRGWLRDNRGNVETFQIGKATTREEARRIEREAILVCVALNHRLFNEQHVPAKVRASRSVQAQAA